VAAAPRKGGKRHEVPCHSELALYLTVWTQAAGIGSDEKTPLFRVWTEAGGWATGAYHGHVTLRRVRYDQAASSGRWAALLHLLRYVYGRPVSPVSRRYWRSGACPDHRNHESLRTTKLYDRTRESLSADEIQRIRI